MEAKEEEGKEEEEGEEPTSLSILGLAAPLSGRVDRQHRHCVLGVW